MTAASDCEVSQPSAPKARSISQLEVPAVNTRSCFRARQSSASDSESSIFVVAAKARPFSAK